MGKNFGASKNATSGNKGNPKTITRRNISKKESDKKRKVSEYNKSVVRNERI